MTEMTNTLFRFATARTPELLDAAAKEKYFLQHPSPKTDGHFKDLLSDPEPTVSQQRDELKTLADTFTTAWTNVDQVNTLAGASLSSFASWIAKNVTALGNEEIDVEDYGSLISIPVLGEEEVLELWDNLFFQLITSQAPPVRERVIEVLIANNLLSDSLTGYDGKLAGARVVIPQELFGKLGLAPDPTTPAPGTINQLPLKKMAERAAAKNRIERLNQLKTELENARKAYDKANLAAYNTARAAYDTDVADKLEESTDYDEATFETKVGRWTNSDFSFTPADQITTTLINSFTTLSKALATQLSLADLDTFEEAFDKVNKEIVAAQSFVFDTTETTEKVVLLNRTALPVANLSPYPRQQYAYYVYNVPIAANTYKFFLVINMGYEGTDIVSTSHYVANTMDNFWSYEAVDRSEGNYLIMELCPEQDITFYSGGGQFEIMADLRLADGTSISIYQNGIATFPYSGWATVNTGSQQQQTASEDIEKYIPAGFGIRRLGIADYRQVEQTTCCYVPGEVSHIENVMAREYKEKSSRRLRRSEETITTEKQTEKEDLTDTTSTDRYEMQQQVSEVINSDQSASVNTNAQYGFGKNVTFGLSSNFANNSSQQQSNSQAITYAKDVTQRAQERVVRKIREERVLKIIDEYEEQNKHGFDNRKGDAHVSGVYRWVDKIYKNKLFNYGKRLMYEFMVPQPSVFHNVAMKLAASSSNITVLEKPVDPRTKGLKDHRDVTDNTAATWAAVFNTEIEAAPEAIMSVSKSWKLQVFDQSDDPTKEMGAIADKIDLPDGYKGIGATVNYLFYYHPRGMEETHIVVAVADATTPIPRPKTHICNTHYLPFTRPVNREAAVGIEANDYSAFSVNVIVHCERTESTYRQWQLNTFNAIIKAYEEKLALYNQSLSAATDTAGKSTNPLFYRQIENMVLRKNCVAYLVGESNMGKDFYIDGPASDLHVNLTDKMDRYSSLAKFIEQAFEWDIISYTFYPFYWGNRGTWQSMYQAEVDDSLFRSFLQSGMARVVATVRPGFEEAVMYYMATGQVWNGGQVPIIGDDLYLSIVEELKHPTYYVEETWETRVPTTLTVIQSNGIGLNATGLPCCHEGEESEFVNSTAKMEGADAEEEGGGSTGE